jgi:hypothetical protein
MRGDGKRQAALMALLDLQEAADQDDVEAAQEIRENRLVRMLGSFSVEQNEALQQVWDVSGRWVRYVDGTAPVRETLKRAIPLFEH